MEVLYSPTAPYVTARLNQNERFKYQNELINKIVIHSDRHYIHLYSGALSITADRRDKTIPQNIIAVLEYELTRNGNPTGESKAIAG
jgi:hypothetical protein